MTVELIRFRPEFREEVAQLLTEFWPDPDDCVRHFSWLQEQNPFAEAPLVHLARRNCQIVGVHAFYGARWEVSGTGKVFDAPGTTMFVIDRAHRGSGLASFMAKGALEDLAADGHRYVLSFSARPITYKGQLQDGWRLVQSYREVRRDSGALRLRRMLGHQLPFLRRIRSVVSSRSPAPGKPATDRQKGAFTAFDAAPVPALDDGTLRVTREPDIGAMQEIAAATASPGLIRHVRTPDYLMWRYRAPLQEYRFLYWSQDGALGYLVLQARRGDARVVQIVDWETTQTDVLKRLIDAAIDLGQFKDLSVRRAVLPDELTGFLAERGFSPIDQPSEVAGYQPGMLVKSLAGSQSDEPWEIFGADITDPTNWSLRPIYSI